jgi:citrate lyase subunit beta/citryl-CoA lyase
MATELSWRSLLYVPVTAKRFVEKAHTRGADAIQLDLEDSIPAAQKVPARGLLAECVEFLRDKGVDIVVRINNTEELVRDDLRACVLPGVKAVAIPKVASAASVREYDALVREQEARMGLAEGSIRFIIMIETALGFCDMDEIARACPRICAMTLGSEDFATSIGIQPEADLLRGPKLRCVIAARAAGIVPLGLAGSVAGYQDEEAFRALARESRRLGFVGASAIHPKQVPILNEAFMPGADEVEQAREIVQAYAESVAQGVGAIEVGGKMVDEPIVERARAVLRLHERLSGRGH